MLIRVLTLIYFQIFFVSGAIAQDDSEVEKNIFPPATFGIKAGVNASRFSTSINSEPRTKSGGHVGIFVRKQIDKYVFIRPELYYSSQGQEDNYVFAYGGGPSIGHTKTTMHCINLPVIFEVGKALYFQGGVQFGLLVAARERGTVASVKVDENLKDVMSALDFGAVAGVGYSPNQRISYGVRYNLGLSNIYTPNNSIGSSDPPSVYNRVLHIYIALSF